MYFHLCDNKEIADKAYDFIFSLCDGAEYMFGRIWQENYGLEGELAGSGYEGIYPALLKKEKKTLWGMEGYYYLFSLSSDCVREAVKTNGLEGMIRLGVGKQLENLSLYKDGKRVYSVCSHEGYTDIDGGFERKVSDFCLEEIEKTKLYREMKEIYGKLPECFLKEAAAKRSVLYDLRNYVDEASHAWIYQPPERACSFEEYRELARFVFTDDILSVLDKAESFAELHPAGFPPKITSAKTGEERERILHWPRFEDSGLYTRAMEELDMLDVVFYKERNISFRTDEEADEEPDGARGPSLIISDTG